MDFWIKNAEIVVISGSLSKYQNGYKNLCLDHIPTASTIPIPHVNGYNRQRRDSHTFHVTLYVKGTMVSPVSLGKSADFFWPWQLGLPSASGEKLNTKYKRKHPQDPHILPHWPYKDTHHTIFVVGSRVVPK